MKQEEQETLANFRFSLIAPLVTRELSKGERQKILAESSGQTHLTPRGECKRFSIRTLERYVAAYEKNGPAGLVPKLRKDAAHCRVIPPELLDKAVALKLEAPDRSIRQIIRILELTGSCPEGFLKPSTLSNHLFEAEPVQKLVEGNKEACRHYEMAYRNQVWQADTQHTLYLPHPTLPNKRRLAYLIVFLDDYSRLITHGEFFFEENVLAWNRSSRRPS